jgi:hypothetical protein
MEDPIMGSDTTKTSINLSKQTDDAQRQKHADEKKAQAEQDAAGGEKQMGDHHKENVVITGKPPAQP